ncbi:hypothetical protein DRJ48_02485 [Candidatus Woesearchaeota archaeon]|nr:MAG: hypothetical protein DRJ48_02485 [Candidatus Woesearchaeota archaeon]
MVSLWNELSPEPFKPETLEGALIRAENTQHAIKFALTSRLADVVQKLTDKIDDKEPKKYVLNRAGAQAVVDALSDELTKIYAKKVYGAKEDEVAQLPSWMKEITLRALLNDFGYDSKRMLDQLEGQRATPDTISSVVDQLLQQFNQHVVRDAATLLSDPKRKEEVAKYLGPTLKREGLVITNPAAVDPGEYLQLFRSKMYGSPIQQLAEQSKYIGPLPQEKK